MSTASLFYLLLFLLLVIVSICYCKAGGFLKCLFFTAFSGLGALGLVWIIGRFTALPIAITPFTCAISGLLGVPGVVFMIVFPMI